MNAIKGIGQSLAMDGQNYSSVPLNKAGTGSVDQTLKFSDGAAVAKNIEERMAQAQENARIMQRLSAPVNGRTLQFSVNEELGSVVVRVVDSSTNTVLKEIPSEDVQRMKINMRKTIGLLFDKMV